MTDHSITHISCIYDQNTLYKIKHKYPIIIELVTRIVDGDQLQVIVRALDNISSLTEYLTAVDLEAANFTSCEVLNCWDVTRFAIQEYPLTSRIEFIQFVNEVIVDSLTKTLYYLIRRPASLGNPSVLKYIVNGTEAFYDFNNILNDRTLIIKELCNHLIAHLCNIFKISISHSIFSDHTYYALCKDRFRYLTLNPVENRFQVYFKGTWSNNYEGTSSHDILKSSIILRLIDFMSLKKWYLPHSWLSFIEEKLDKNYKNSVEDLDKEINRLYPSLKIDKETVEKISNTNNSSINNYRALIENVEKVLNPTLEEETGGASSSRQESNNI